MRMISKGAMVCVALATGACGKAQQGSDAPLPSGALTAEQIAESQAGNMYDAIRLLRPDWLRRSGRSPTSLSGPAAGIVVYLDGQRFGDVEALRRLLATSVSWAEYLSPSQAQARFGHGNLAGVIHIHTRGTGGD